ncbi:MAG: hypothetical protein ACJ8NR_11440 [Sulfurifustis sp.]
MRPVADGRRRRGLRLKSVAAHFVSARWQLTAVLAIVAACATTQLKEQWRDPDYHAASPQRFMVIGVIGREERRRVFEDEFVQRLRKAGVEAMPSYPKLAVSGPENLDVVRRVVDQSGATLVLSVRLVDLTQETRVTGGYYAPVGFYGYYPTAYAGTYYPPSAYSYRKYTTETRVFDMKGDKMVWAAAMESEEPTDFRAAAAQYADLVVKQLQYNKVIGPG